MHHTIIFSLINNDDQGAFRHGFLVYFIGDCASIMQKIQSSIRRPDKIESEAAKSPEFHNHQLNDDQKLKNSSWRILLWSMHIFRHVKKCEIQQTEEAYI